MPHYLFQVSFTAEAARALLETAPDREAAARTTIESAGGKLLSYHWAFGATDVYCIADLPSNTDAAAVAMAAASSGAFSKFETTPLLTSAEAMAAMRRGKDVTFVAVPS
jgi:uncharacterized protein with GYD domain